MDRKKFVGELIKIARHLLEFKLDRFSAFVGENCSVLNYKFDGDRYLNYISIDSCNKERTVVFHGNGFNYSCLITLDEYLELIDVFKKLIEIQEDDLMEYLTNYTNM